MVKHNILYKLSQRKDLVFIKADKGNSVVIMTKVEYIDKMLDILNDSSKFKRVESDNTMNRMERFQTWLRNHKFLFSQSSSTYDEIYPSSAAIPTMYGLPKIHKAERPIRPILFMIGAFNHSFAKYMCTLLEPLRRSPSMCKDYFSLCKLIQSSELHKAYLVSYDVKSLFTNVPIDEVIEIILNKLFPNGLGKKTYLYEEL